MTQPTKRQSEYLEFIRAFTDRWGTPPSFEEIGKHFRTTPPSVNSFASWPHQPRRPPPFVTRRRRW